MMRLLAFLFSLLQAVLFFLLLSGFQTLVHEAAHFLAGKCANFPSNKVEIGDSESNDYPWCSFYFLGARWEFYGLLLVGQILWQESVPELKKTHYWGTLMMILSGPLINLLSCFWVHQLLLPTGHAELLFPSAFCLVITCVSVMDCSSGTDGNLVYRFYFPQQVKEFIKEHTTGWIVAYGNDLAMISLGVLCAGYIILFRVFPFLG